MSAPEAPTVKVGDITMTLVKPGATFALALCRTEEQRATDNHEVGKVLGAAALAMCWPHDKAWPSPIRPTRWYAGERVERYGQQVLDDLVEAGGLYVIDLLDAFTDAYNWAITSRITREEVNASADFSEAAPAA